jgi:superfamily II DNA or RNA helicase
MAKHILVFMSSVKEAEDLSENLKLKGISSAIISAKTPKKERADILKQFKEGKIKVVTNFGTLTTGYDFPELDCVILGRPTQSVALYYQMVGRGIRIAPGKEKTKIIDICGNVKRFGKIENFEIVEDKPNMHRLRSDTSYLSGFCFYRNIDLEENDYKGLKEVDFGGKEILKFGKYKGQHVSKIPNSYLSWCLENLKGSFKDIFQKELDRREKSRAEKLAKESVPF